MIVHVNIHISGYVQRVGFRYSARRAALELGLTGFVSNLPDGSVYAEAEGEQETVDQFVRWCHEGPSMARVENVKTESSELKGFSSFDII